MSHYTRNFCLPSQEISCCFDETNIHRNPAFQQGANLSCPTTTCRMYTRPFNVPLAHVGHSEGEKKKITAIQTDRMRWIPALSGWGPIHNRTWVTVQSTAHMDFFVPHSPSFPIHDNKTLQAMSNFEPFYCIIYLSYILLICVA